MRIWICGAVLLTLCACAASTRGMSQEEWLRYTSRVYPASPEATLAAAEKVLTLADGSDFRITRSEGGFEALRRWTSPELPSGALGVDLWTIKAQLVSGGTRLTVRVVSGTSPVRSADDGGDDQTVSDMARKGAVIESVALYSLFWTRFDYVIGQGNVWLNCANFREKVLEDEDALWGSDAPLCAPSLSDKAPDGWVEPPKPPKEFPRAVRP